MKLLKNILSGLIVSYIGSLPMGYLNLIGMNIYLTSGFTSLVLFISGIMLVEFFIIWGTLAFSGWLAHQDKLVTRLRIFTAVFMFTLAGWLYFGQPQHSAEPMGAIATSDHFGLFLLGAGLSMLNFMQIPFWAGWNIYLITNNLVFNKGWLRFVFIVSAVVGTLGGMVTFTLSVREISEWFNSDLNKVMKWLLPLIFLLLGLQQTVAIIRASIKRSS
jgi:threonine/homoserine/homoserine lactone efflux protein